MKNLPQFYQTHFQTQLTRPQCLVLNLLVALIQEHKQVKLEGLAKAFPLWIKFASRRRKIQRFLVLPQLTLVNIWFPLVTYWLSTYCPKTSILYIAIDRSQWGGSNLLMVSLIWDKRAIPLSWILLPKLGASNLESQKIAIGPVLSLLKEYKTVVLGDREFCCVDLAKWLREQGVYFCLRLKRSEFIQLEGQIWLQLQTLGLVPGVCLYFRGVKVTKAKGLTGFNVACKWQRKYQGWAPEEGWFILTNLSDLKSAISAYKKRFCIEEMFKDCKSGGYNIEKAKVAEQRLNSLILLIAIAYTSALVQGCKIKRMGVQKYICRVKEPKRLQRRHSTFHVGLNSMMWVNSVEQHADEMAELMRLSPNKRQYYQRGRKAVQLIRKAS